MSNNIGDMVLDCPAWVFFSFFGVFKELPIQQWRWSRNVTITQATAGFEMKKWIADFLAFFHLN